MVKNIIVLAQKIFYMSLSKNKFTTINAAERLMKSMEVAINNMIDEVKNLSIQKSTGQHEKLSFSL